MHIQSKSHTDLLVITSTWPPMPCGVGDYSARLCEHLLPFKFRIRVFTSQAQPQAFILPGQGSLELLPKVRQWSWPMLEQLRQVVAAHPPDIILFQWPTAAYGRSLAVNWLPRYLKTRFPKIPLITTIHELRYFRPWTRLRIWPALQASDRVVLVDPQDLAVAAGLHAAVHEKISLIPIGSNIPDVARGFRRAEQRRSLGLGPREFVVVFFGLANPPKGLELLLAALARLKPRFPQLKLLLVADLSDKNAYQRRLLQTLAQTGMQAWTLRQAYAPPERVAELLACADCGILPFRDGVSLKRGSLLACLTQGLPVICTRPPAGEARPFQHEKNLLLAAPGQVDSLMAALTRIIIDGKLRRKLSQRAKKLAAGFSWTRIARLHRDLMKKLLEEKR